MGRNKVEEAKLSFMKNFKETISLCLIKVLSERGWVRTETKVDAPYLFKVKVYKKWPSKPLARIVPSTFVEVTLYTRWEMTKGYYQVEVMICRKGEKPVSLQLGILALNGQMPAEDDVAKLKVFLKACVDIAVA